MRPRILRESVCVCVPSAIRPGARTLQTARHQQDREHNFRCTHKLGSPQRTAWLTPEKRGRPESPQHRAPPCALAFNLNIEQCRKHDPAEASLTSPSRRPPPTPPRAPLPLRGIMTVTYCIMIMTHSLPVAHLTQPSTTTTPSSCTTVSGPPNSRRDMGETGVQSRRNARAVLTCAGTGGCVDLLQ